MLGEITSSVTGLPALREERDGLAAALETALHLMSCPLSHCKQCDAFRLYDQPAAILAARDARMRAEGRKAGLLEAAERIDRTFGAGITGAPAELREMAEEADHGA